jgi:hypothetical protein
MDDVFLLSDSMEEQAKSLVHVLERFEKANLQQLRGKSVFAQREMQ